MTDDERNNATTEDAQSPDAASPGPESADEKPKKIGDVHDQSGRRTTKLRGKDRLIDFGALPVGLQEKAGDLLENGFTFEETTEWINERHAEGVTLSAVAEFFRSNSGMQARRVHRLQEVAQELKKHLTGDPHSALGEAAFAVLVTGLMGLTKASANFTVRDAQRHYVAQQRLDQQGEVSAARVATETLKQEEARAKINALKRAIRKESGRRRLGADTLKSIQEIYGLIDVAAEEQPLQAEVKSLPPATSAGNEEPA